MDRQLLQLKRAWVETEDPAVGERYTFALLRAGFPFRVEGVKLTLEGEAILEEAVDRFLATSDRVNKMSAVIKAVLIEDCDFDEHRIYWADSDHPAESQTHKIRAERYGGDQVFVRSWFPSKALILTTGKMREARLVVSGSPRLRPDVIDALMDKLPQIAICSDLIERQVREERLEAARNDGGAVSERCYVPWVHAISPTRRELLHAPPTLEELAGKPGQRVVGETQHIINSWLD